MAARVMVAGYFAVCPDCPWNGQARITRGRAQKDATEHNRDEHGWRLGSRGPKEE